MYLGNVTCSIYYNHLLIAAANSFAWDLYKTTGVSVLDAGAFGVTSQGWIRISYGVDEQRLEEACRRIIAFTHS